MITLFAKLKAKPGKENLLAEECIKMAKEAREKEDGCLMYIPHVSLDNPAEITIVEKYKDQKAFDGHFETPYFKAFAKTIEDLLDAPLDLQKAKELI